MGLLDIGAQLLVNRQNRKNAIKDWERQNTYNHPKQQMQRLKEAGLNPNLVYGGGATTLAQPVHSPQAQAPNVETVPQMLGQFVDLQNKGLQKNNMQNALKIQQEEILNKEAQRKNLEANTLSTLTGIDLKKLDITAKEIFNKFLPEYAQERNRALKTGTDIKINQNEMEKLMFPNKVEEVLANIANIKGRTSMIPAQKEKLQKEIQQINQRIHYFGLTESQRYETGKVIQQSEMLKTLMQGKQLRGQELQNELMQIKKGFKEAGLSETQTSDLVKQLLSIVDFF